MRPHRAMAVLDPIELEVTNLEHSVACDVEFSTPDGAASTRTLVFGKKNYIERDDFAIVPPPKYKRLTVGGTVRLKGAFIVTCNGYETDGDGNVTKVLCTYHSDSKSGADTSGIKPKGVIHWVGADDCVDITVNKLDFLLLPDDGQKLDFSLRLNPESKVTYAQAKGERCLAEAEGGDVFQFMRQAYYSRDPKADGLVFNEVVTLKDGYKPAK